MKNWLIFVAVSIIVSCNTSGKKIDAESSPTIDHFFSQLEKNNYLSAFNDLIATNPNILPSDSDALDLRTKLTEITKYSGPYRGHTLINKKNVRDDLAAYSYLVKFDKKFYRFIFTFYNNGVSTRIYKFSIDSQTESELEESLKFFF